MQLRPYQSDLINATRNAFRTARRPLVVLGCGGGKTVCFADMARRHITARSGAYVWFLVHRRELIDQTVETFNTWQIPMDNIYVGMVQTVARRLSEFPTPTLIIFDEAHHATARQWRTIIDYHANVPVVGLTATPIRLDGEPLGDIFDALICGVDSEWLMDNGYLAQYEYFAPRKNDIAWRTRGKDFDMLDVETALEKSQIYGDVAKYIDTTRKTIIYAPTVAMSRRIADTIPGVVHFDGDTPSVRRREIVDKFRRGDIRVLSNCDLIGEGFDVPDCDTVILLRPTRSMALYIQQSMRCLRPRDGKIARIYDLVANVYRHGMPTETRAWSLKMASRCKNPDAEPDLLVRECRACYRVYNGTARTCPYCGNDNGKTRRQIEADKEAELEQVKKIARIERGRAQTLEDLIAVGRSRGYKNPEYWAKMVYNGRSRRT